MKRRSGLVLGAALLLGNAGSSTALASDPGAEPQVHDPSLWLDAQGQWIFCTGEGLQRLHSPDGQRWTRLPPVFNARTKPAWWSAHVPDHKGLDMWAPKLFAHRGRLWVMYSISTFGKPTSAMGLASVDTREGPGAATWRDDDLVLASTPTSGFNAIDPDVFTDSAGHLWLAWGSWWQGLQVSALDAGTLRPVGDTVYVARRRGGIEAPTLMQRGGWFYLFMSWGLCCKGVDSTYEMRVGRSRAAQGPFADRDGRPLMEGGGTLLLGSGPRWKGPGHQDVVGDQLVWHAYDAEAAGQPTLRRGTLRWSEDDWPTL